MSVQYRIVRRFGKYRVGTDGSVWSKHSGEWVRLKPHSNGYGRGYMSVELFGDGFSKRIYVHVLVLETFVGPCPKGMQCCHFPDPSPANNNLTNIRWATRQDNMEDQRKHGTLVHGERHGMHILTVEDVKVILRMKKEGFTQKERAERFGVSRETVNQIDRGRNWREVPRI